MSSQETSESTDTTAAAAGVPRWLTAVSLVVLVVGITMLIDRLRFRRLMGGDDDPNIIDAL